MQHVHISKHRIYVCIHVCICIYMYLFMYLYLCIYVFVSTCIYASMYLCICIYMYLCIYVTREGEGELLYIVDITQRNLTTWHHFNRILLVFSCSLSQYIGSFQKKYSIGSFELLKKTAPFQAMSLLFLGPFVDYILNGKNILAYPFSPGSIVSSKRQIFHVPISLEFERKMPSFDG
mgnify:CR=1 FL=1